MLVTLRGPVEPRTPRAGFGPNFAVGVGATTVTYRSASALRHRVGHQVVVVGPGVLVERTPAGDDGQPGRAVGGEEVCRELTLAVDLPRDDAVGVSTGRRG